MKYPTGGKPPWEHSNRSVHGYPASYHRWYLEESVNGQGGMYWANLLQSMYMSWIVLITDGDSVLEQCNIPNWGKGTPLEFFLDNRVVPIVRDSTDKFPNSYTNWSVVERAVPIYEKFGLKPMWICRNEPGDGREHQSGVAPPLDDEGMTLICGILQNDMNLVVASGGIAGFPDAPCYSRNPWHYLDRHLWDNGLAYFAGHHYGVGREVDHPYNDVARYGVPLTEEEYSEALDDFADDPAWRDVPLEVMNAQRAALANPDLTAVEEPVCWRGWERVVAFAQEALGYIPPMAVTEGGWTPRDRAGSGPNTDTRWALTTPRMVAKKTLAMYNDNSPHFAIAPWLIADDAMSPGGYVGWPYESWVGWAYADMYGFEKPVVQMLQENPPGPTPVIDVEAAKADFRAASLAVESMLRNLGE